MLVVKTKRAPPSLKGGRPVAWSALERGRPQGCPASAPLPPPPRTQARVELARVAVLPLQVLTVLAQLPGVPKALHQGLHQPRGGAEVVALVAVVVPTQAARLPRVHRGQLRGERATLEPLPPEQPQLPFASETVFNQKRSLGEK